MSGEASRLDEFESPAADSREPGYPTEVDLLLVDGRVFIRFEQQNESRRGVDVVVITQAKFLELAERMRNIQ